MNQNVSSDASKDNHSEEDIREAFRVLTDSETFTGSDRLIGFLGYVLNEKLEGRGEQIRGKSIAMDVYGYNPDEVEKRESVVRVDAGRVRRKLREYYSSEGSNTHLRIDLPKGGYAPVFLNAPQPAAPEPGTSPTGSLVWRAALLFAVGIGAVFGAFVFWNNVQAKAPDDAKVAEDAAKNLRRAVLFDTSPARLQAVNLAEQGRMLIFPATDPERLRAAMHVFEAAKKLDASYAGGYAGASQVSGMMALTAPNPERSGVLQKRSKNLADQSLELAPDMPWAISARAWAHFAAGDYVAAMEWSKRAKELAPEDPNILEFDALILLYNGMFQAVLEETGKLSESRKDPLPFVFQNARSSAFFHLGEYKLSIEGFVAAISDGAPLGPITVAYMMAAHEKLGDTERAEELASQYRSTWPNHRVDLVKKRLFKNTVHSDQLINGMLAAGWKPD